MSEDKAAPQGAVGNPGFGYSVKIIQRNAEADQSHLGVQLGAVCIAKGIPVIEIAEYFGISRPAVYNWFCGKSKPRKDAAEKIQNLIQRLTA